MEDSSQNAHAIPETGQDTRVKINTSIAGSVIKYNNLHTHESFDK